MWERRTARRRPDSDGVERTGTRLTLTNRFSALAFEGNEGGTVQDEEVTLKAEELHTEVAEEIPVEASAGERAKAARGSSKGSWEDGGVGAGAVSAIAGKASREENLAARRGMGASRAGGRPGSRTREGVDAGAAEASVDGEASEALRAARRGKGVLQVGEAPDAKEPSEAVVKSVEKNWYDQEHV